MCCFRKKKQKEVIMDNTKLHKFIGKYFIDNKLPVEEITLIGIRDSKDQDKDVINDYLGFWTKKELFLVKGTTEPGVYWVKNKEERNKKGTFHLLEGFHEKIWSIGTHKGYEALVNDYRYCKKTSGWRDANYNFTRDDKDILVSGYFGINFHRAHPIAIVDRIGKYSGGCQVIQDAKNFKYILDKFKETNMFKKNKHCTVNYQLFTINDIPKEYLI
jgi:hypothetical protein